MVHAAEWTPAMRAQFDAARNSGLPGARPTRGSSDGSGGACRTRPACSGAPGSALTLMVEDTLEPIDAGRVGTPLKEMKYFKLPWPEDALRALGASPVEMRCTLSYFVEPDLHAVARDRMERYPSHRLRFDVKRTARTDDAQAQARVNALADEGDPVEGHERRRLGVGGGWPAQRTLHHDIWRGPALRLVERGGISVLPVRGWWGDTRSFGRDGRS